MTDTADFLVELGSEELPPKALDRLSESFHRGVLSGLRDRRLAFEATTRYATPRRLAVAVAGLQLRQEDHVIERRGPAVKAAYDDAGQPTKAALGFARSCGVDVGALTVASTAKGEWLQYSGVAPGAAAAELLPAIVRSALDGLPIPKRMRWGASETEFVRPVHWLLMMLGERTLDATILGLTAGNLTYGHRFHHPAPIEVDSPAAYPELLGQAQVIAAVSERRASVESLVKTAAAEAGATALIDPALLDEVTALVEWPVPVCGSFDRHFLELPREVLVASMQGHQKYFPLEDADGALTNRFVTVSNIDSSNPDAVRSGNERVIRPRLADAAFFWRQDCALDLDQAGARLDGIVFEKRLGSLGDKTRRVAALAAWLAAYFAAAEAMVSRAATLSRADLVTQMVGEFPELQGTIGGYYAAAAGEAPDVVTALGEFYRPRFAGDAIPESPAGRCIAFADKLDTLVGIFGIGMAPSGDKDPYALRRAALGCLRIAIEGRADVPLAEAIGRAHAGYGETLVEADSDAQVLRFFHDRLRGYYVDSGRSADTVEAVLAVAPTGMADFDRRIAAVSAFRALPEAAALAAANKRIGNILRKNATTEAAASLDPSRLVEPAEQALAAAVEEARSNGQPVLRNGAYADYLTVLARLRDPVDRFFDEVMVMAEDPALRSNRLALLHGIQDQFRLVADVSLIDAA